MFNRRPKIPIDWDRIEASAPGRFVFMGEFGDLDDKNAIAVALDRRLKVTIRPHKEGYLRLNLKDFKNVREWPTSSPVFTMTKLVANYADPLTYSETLQQTLKPLLNQKYYKTSLNVQQHSTRMATAADATAATSDARDDASDNSESSESGSSSGDRIKTSPAGTTLRIMETEAAASAATNDDDGLAGPQLPEAEIKPVPDPQDLTTSEQEPPLFHEVRNLSARVLDPTSQTDSTVIAFFMLYIALGDSFAGSARPSLDVVIESEIPMCRGLGSSTALGVALCGALMKVFRISAEPTVTIEWAHSVDKLFHTTVTGLHASVVTNGGYIYYQKDRVKAIGMRHLVPLGVMLIDTGIRREPKEVTRAVVKMLKIKHELINMVLNQLSAFASTLWRQINDQQFKTAAIRQNILLSQGILCGLGLDHDRIDTIQRMAHHAGLAVKQSQAGETLFLIYDEIDDSVTQFAASLEEAGFKFTHHEIEFEGLTVTRTAVADSPA